MTLPQHVLDRIRAINDADSPLTPEQERVLQRAFLAARQEGE